MPAMVEDGNGRRPGHPRRWHDFGGATGREYHQSQHEARMDELAQGGGPLGVTLLDQLSGAYRGRESAHILVLQERIWGAAAILP